VRDTEHLGEYVEDLMLKFFLVLAREELAGSLEGEGEEEGLGDGESGSVDVVLCEWRWKYE
jgi:hypothetical protein